jgi:hypothetical protein
MTVTQKLGSSFASVREKLKFRTVRVEFDDAAFDLRVRIPLKHEMEAISDRIQNPSAEHIEKIYKRFSAPLLETIKDGGDEFLKALNDGDQKIVITSDDVSVSGTSMRQVALMTAMSEVRTQEYFRLLQSETGEPITESFEEITFEFPEQVIKLVVEAIDNAIKPDYQNSKKN